MNRLLQIIIFLFVTFTAVSQRDVPFAKIEISELFKKPKGTEFMDIIECPEFLVAAWHSPGIIYFDKLGAANKIISSKELSYVHKNGKTLLLSLNKTENSLVIFTMHRNKKFSSYDVYAQVVSLEDFEAATPHLLFSVDDREGNPEMITVMSQNGKYFGFIYYKPAEKKYTMAAEMRVFDAELEQVWLNTFDSYENATFLCATENALREQFLGFTLSNSGSAAIESVVYPADEQIEVDSNVPSRFIVSITESGNNVTAHKIDISRLFIDNSFYKWHDETLYVAGVAHEIISNKDLKCNVGKGNKKAFLYSINCEVNDVRLPVVQDVDSSRSFYYKNIEFSNDTISLIGEECGEYTSMVGNSFVHILVSAGIYINYYNMAEHVFLESVKVNKYQNGVRPVYHSFIYSKAGETRYFVFNENCRNLELEAKGKELAGFDKDGIGRNTCVYIAEVNPEKRVKKYILYSIDDVDALLTEPINSSALKNGDIILLAHRNNKYKFIRIRFNG